jgi:hypothetical protein
MSWWRADAVDGPETSSVVPDETKAKHGRPFHRDMPPALRDAHRHLGVLPAYPFYGGPPIRADISARATIDELIADLDREGTERALVIPNYGIPDATASFGFNSLVVEAAQGDERIRAGIWTSPRPTDSAATAAALALAGEAGVRALRAIPNASPFWIRSSRRLSNTISSSTCTPRPVAPPISTRSGSSSNGTATPCEFTSFISVAG